MDDRIEERCQRCGLKNIKINFEKNQKECSSCGYSEKVKPIYNKNGKNQKTKRRS